MHITITETMFIEQFRIMDRMNNFSLDGLKALFAYFEDLEDDIGQSIECDVIAICCDYQELTIEEIIDQYSDQMDEDELSELEDDEDKVEYVIDVMCDNTTVIRYREDNELGLKEPVIIQSF